MTCLFTKSITSSRSVSGRRPRHSLQAARVQRCTDKAAKLAGTARLRRAAPHRTPIQEGRSRGPRWLARTGFWAGVLVFAGLVGVATGASDGPVWHWSTAQSPDAAADPLHAELEQAYHGRLSETRALVLDPEVVAAGPAAVGPHLAARLNADGHYASLHWQDFVDSLAESPGVARAVWRPFLGGPHGQGIQGYLGLTGVCAIVPPGGVPTHAHDAAVDLPADVSPDFWRRIVLTHEFEHCVDYDRDGAGAAVDAAALADDAAQHDTSDVGLSPRELYADAATVLRLLSEGWEVADLRRFAALRSTDVAVELKQGRVPSFSHFTAPMLEQLLDDVAAGTLTPATMSDADLHATASAYRDAALGAAAGFEPWFLRRLIDAGARDPARLLHQAGAPESWSDALKASQG